MNRKGIRTDGRITQAIMGHGNFEGYKKRFGLKETNGICECGRNEEEDIEHAWFRYEKNRRIEAINRLKEGIGKENIEEVVWGVEREENWDRWIEFWKDSGGRSMGVERDREKGCNNE